MNNRVLYVVLDNDRKFLQGFSNATKMYSFFSNVSGNTPNTEKNKFIAVRKKLTDEFGFVPQTVHYNEFIVVDFGLAPPQVSFETWQNIREKAEKYATEIYLGKMPKKGVYEVTLYYEAYAKRNPYEDGGYHFHTTTFKHVASYEASSKYDAYEQAIHILRKDVNLRFACAKRFEIDKVVEITPA